jgi:hypothetical protein
MKSQTRGVGWRWLAAAMWPAFFSATASAAQTLLADDPSIPYDPTPQRLVWPGVAIIIVIAIFVTAALAGPLIRANADESTDPAPSSPENSE